MHNTRTSHRPNSTLTRTKRLDRDVRSSRDAACLLLMCILDANFQHGEKVTCNERRCASSSGNIRELYRLTEDRKNHKCKRLALQQYSDESDCSETSSTSSLQAARLNLDLRQLNNWSLGRSGCSRMRGTWNKF